MLWNNYQRLHLRQQILTLLMRNPLFKVAFLIAILLCALPAPADEAPVECAKIR